MKPTPHPLRDVTRAQLLAAPNRSHWSLTLVYRGLYFVPLRRRHDSGWGAFAIVGRCLDGVTLERTGTFVDDVSFTVRGKNPVRVDLTYPGGIFHYWGKVVFTVCEDLGSVEIVVDDAPEA